MTKRKPKQNSVIKDNGVLQDFTMGAIKSTEVSGLKGLQNNLRYSALTQNRMLLTEMIQEHALLRRFVRQPIEDAYRGGVLIKCDELSADDLATLNQKMEEAQDLQTLIEARMWTEVFGGGGLIVNAGQEFDQEFTIDQIQQDGELEFYPVDRWELATTTNGNILDQTQDFLGDVPYLYYGHRLHKTCVLRMIGEKAPSMIRGQFSGWGVSRLEGIVRSWNQYLKNQEVMYELTDEMKVDVFRMEGFNETLASSDGAQKAAQRVQLAAELKNYKSALVMDKDDEYEQKSLSLSGMAEAIAENRKSIAADLGTPMTKLFGISAAGFNSGEDDLETWNAKVESEVRAKDRNILLFMIQSRCQQLFGYVPETISFEFHSLRVLSADQEEAIKSQKFDRIMRLFDSKLVPTSKVIELMNAEKIFALDLDADETDDSVEPALELPEGEAQPKDDDYQSEALNGAQVTSLVEIIAQITAGMIPKESASAIIKAAFPTFTDELIAKIISPIQESSTDAQQPEGIENSRTFGLFKRQTKG